MVGCRRHSAASPHWGVPSYDLILASASPRSGAGYGAAGGDALEVVTDRRGASTGVYHPMLREPEVFTSTSVLTRMACRRKILVPLCALGVPSPADGNPLFYSSETKLRSFRRSPTSSARIPRGPGYNQAVRVGRVPSTWPADGDRFRLNQSRGRRGAQARRVFGTSMAMWQRCRFLMSVVVKPTIHHGRRQKTPSAINAAYTPEFFQRTRCRPLAGAHGLEVCAGGGATNSQGGRHVAFGSEAPARLPDFTLPTRPGRC